MTQNPSNIQDSDHKTSLTTSSIQLGLGCSGPWGQRWFSDAKAQKLIEQAIASGILHFDTAGFYGVAQERLARALSMCDQARVFVSTKTGTLSSNGKYLGKDFSEKAIRADVEFALRHFKRENLDLVYLHGPDNDQLESASQVLLRLKDEGKVSLVGVCTQGKWLEAAANCDEVDVVMGAFSIYDRSHEALLREAKAKGKKVVAISPLGQGRFRKDFYLPRSLSDGWRIARDLSKRLASKSEPCPELGERGAVISLAGRSAAQTALAYVLAQDFVDIAMTTTTRAKHLSECVEAAKTPLLAREMVEIQQKMPRPLDD